METFFREAERGRGRGNSKNTIQLSARYLCHGGMDRCSARLPTAAFFVAVLNLGVDVVEQESG